jgi:hypothetical protein
MDIREVQRVRAAAIPRVLARKRPPKIVTYPGAGFGKTDVTGEVDRGSLGEFLDPRTVAEWVDDRECRHPWSGPHAAVLYDVAEAMREGAGAAVAAVKGARELDQLEQWNLFRNLTYWRSTATLPAARKAMGAVIGEWDRLGLADREPSTAALPVKPEPERPAVRKYPTKWGKPAGMTV